MYQVQEEAIDDEVVYEIDTKYLSMGDYVDLHYRVGIVVCLS